MLVLTRRIEESVVIGDSNAVDEMIKVTVLSVVGGRVQLGFESPADVPIHRWEVWQRIREKDLQHKRTKDAAAPLA
jgi:carbon storage regulator